MICVAQGIFRQSHGGYIMTRSGKIRQWLIIAAKIAVGSSAAILLADLFKLDHSASAGIVTLLTLMTTKWETLRLSALRLISFVITMIIGAAVFYLISIDWLSYGIFIFFLIFITYALGWISTISVNAVIGTHLLLDGHFGTADVFNEFMLVVIGIVIALVLNMFHDYRHKKKSIIANMRTIEEKMQKIMRELADFLVNDSTELGKQAEFEALDRELEAFIAESIDYQDNTFHSHPAYYIDYFRMRQSQCHIIFNLHDELERIKTLPARAGQISEYMYYVADNIVEFADPIPQLERAEELFGEMRSDDLPGSPDEFESRALLYHILSDLEEFLRFKQRFILKLTPEQIKEYRS